ncbi:MAG: PilZ domain-containing protein [Candidatus Poseidoniales archaeon]
MKTKHNQRKEERYRVLLPARLTAPHISDLVRVVDISMVGCRFMTTKNLNLQASTTLHFYQTDEMIDPETDEIKVQHHPCNDISCRVVRKFKSQQEGTNVFGVEFMGVVLPEHCITQIIGELEVVRKDNRAANLKAASIKE